MNLDDCNFEGEHRLFDKEEKIIQDSEASLGENGKFDSPVAGYAELLENYKNLLAQTKRLVRMSDSQQKELKQVAVELTHKAGLLAATLDTLHQEIAQRKMLESELRRHASIDALTGVYVRRAIMELGELEVKRMERSGEHLVVLMLDLDHFKSINDNYGHAAGDEALRMFVRVCQENLREVDLLGRVGGEEFVVIMPNTEINDAFAIARRILDKVSVSEVTNETYSFGMTVSIGLSAANSGFQSFDAILARADKALYAAKRTGRNRIEQYPD